MPVQGITHSSQPVMGYNYGAKEYGRVKKAIVFVSAISVLYTLGMWFIVHTFLVSLSVFLTATVTW